MKQAIIILLILCSCKEKKKEGCHQYLTAAEQSRQDTSPIGWVDSGGYALPLQRYDTLGYFLGQTNDTILYMNKDGRRSPLLKIRDAKLPKPRPPCNGCFFPVAHYAITKDTTDIAFNDGFFAGYFAASDRSGLLESSPDTMYPKVRDSADSMPVRRFLCGSAPPSSGKHLLGEYILNVGTDTTIIGFMCIKEGEPGEWQAVRSVIWESEPALVPWIKPETQQGVINSKSIKLVKPHKRWLGFFKRLRKKN